MKNYLIVFVLFVTNMLIAQSEVINLWSTAIPGAIANKDYQEIEVNREGEFHGVNKVVTPTLSMFLPNKEIANGTAVVICPGGGYGHLSLNKEGFKVAQWFNSLGITAFVLKYRLPSDLIMEDKTIGPLQDAQEAIRFLRRNAEKWNLNIDKIGIMGFSAGGHLAATLSTHYNDDVYTVNDEISAKPNFSILIYPVISMNLEITHKGSRKNLLGETPNGTLIEKYSNELQVNSETPKAFLIHATDDTAVPVENSIKYYLALKNNEISAELHLFEKGGHGFGLGIKGTSEYWPKLLQNWLSDNNL